MEKKKELMKEWIRLVLSDLSDQMCNKVDSLWDELVEDNPTKTSLDCVEFVGEAIQIAVCEEAGDSFCCYSPERVKKEREIMKELRKA
jgi:hypothetical protein